GFCCFMNRSVRLQGRPRPRVKTQQPGLLSHRVTNEQSSCNCHATVKRFIASLLKTTHCYVSNLLAARGPGGLLPKAVKTRQHWISKMTNKPRGIFQIKPPFRFSRKGVCVFQLD